jgi:hypothetical protein
MGDLSFLFDGLDEGERIARLQVLRVPTAVYAGWDSLAKRALDDVVLDGADYRAAPEAINRLPALLRRRASAVLPSDCRRHLRHRQDRGWLREAPTLITGFGASP